MSLSSKKLKADLIAGYSRQRATQRALARQFNVSRQYVFHVWKKAGLETTPLPYPPKPRKWHIPKTPEERAGRRLLSQLRRRDPECDLAWEDLAIPSHCPVLGIPLFRSNTGRWADNSPSVDRIDNTIGYRKGNVCIVSWRANKIKNNASITEIKKLAKFYT